jgi:hypothetical protein
MKKIPILGEMRGSGQALAHALERQADGRRIGQLVYIGIFLCGNFYGQPTNNVHII